MSLNIETPHYLAFDLFLNGRTYFELPVAGGSLSLGLLAVAVVLLALDPRDARPARLLRPLMP